VIGANYRILPTIEFSKDFSKINDYSKARIKSKIEEISKDPTRYKRLHYNLKNSSRVRIDKLRILFSYDSKKRELYLEKIIFNHDY